MPRSRDQRIPRWEQLKGAALLYQVDFNPWADSAGETVSSVSASILDSGQHISLGTQTHANGIWSAPVTANSTGTDTVEVTALTTSGNQTRKRRFQITVTDPK